MYIPGKYVQRMFMAPSFSFYLFLFVIKNLTKKQCNKSEQKRPGTISIPEQNMATLYHWSSIDGTGGKT